MIDTQKTIIKALKVIPKIQPQIETDRRKTFIKNQLQNSGLNYLVLGISGGIDSATLGKLSQLAVDELNQEKQQLNQPEIFKFIAVRLPYSTQADESDAQLVLDFIQPDIILDVNIQPGTDVIHDCVTKSLSSQNLLTQPESKIDFVKGNVKARTRMIIQYEIAGLLDGLVLGTDHSAENITGFFTKWGDGACDLIPLFGLNKRQVKQIAKHLNIPEKIIAKAPTADLESLNPGKTDESALGISYTQIDDFLEGKVIEQSAADKLIKIFNQTQHKRRPIATIYD